MAPGLGEWAESQETHGVSTCLTQFLLAFPLRAQATLEEPRSPVGHYQEQVQARNWHGRHCAGLQVVDTR